MCGVRQVLKYISYGKNIKLCEIFGECRADTTYRGNWIFNLGKLHKLERKLVAESYKNADKYVSKAENYGERYPCD